MIKTNHKDKVDISVILPAYNEEASISMVVNKAITALNELGCQGEIIVIDDGSTDNTTKELNSIISSKHRLYIIRHRLNKGLTEALTSGFRQARGDIVVFLCADLQSDPQEDIPKLVNKIRNGYDVVAGWRQGRKESKVFLSKIYNFVCSRLFNLDLHDMNWIKAFKREVIDEIELKSDWHRFILLLAAHKGYKIGEVKTNWYPRKSGKSKFGFTRIPIAFLDILSIRFLLIFMDKPIRFFGFWGILLIAIGFILSIFLILLWYLTNTQLRPLMFFTFFSVLTGIFILMIGFLAELISLQQLKLNKIEEELRKKE